MNGEQQKWECGRRRYLRHLLQVARAIGVPYLPVLHLRDESVRAWIHYLRDRVGVDEDFTEERRASAAPAHDHRIDIYVSDDGYDLLYCTVCGAEW